MNKYNKFTQNRKTFHKNIIPINIAFSKWYFASNKIIFTSKLKIYAKKTNSVLEVKSRVY